MARNHLPLARALARSIARHHSELRLTTLVFDDVDREIDAAEEPFDVARPEDLDFEEREFLEMAAMYERWELACALKPWVLGLLLGRGAEAAVYLDADIELFGRVDDLFELAASHPTVLTPETMRPIPFDGKTPGQVDQLRSGMFNASCQTATHGGADFLAWFKSVLRRHCLVDLPGGLFLDQRWLDLVPAYFDHVVLRDPGLGVSCWNIHERNVELTKGGFVADGVPLRLFHFSQFDPERPNILCALPQRNPFRVEVDDQEAFVRLWRGRSKRLLEAGYRDWIDSPYGYGRTATGLHLDLRMRRLYRDELMAAEAAGELPPPNPVDPDGAEAFAEWLEEPAPRKVAVSRYLQRLYDERLDLQGAFPALDGSDGERYLEWVRTGGKADPPISPDFVLAPGA